MRAGRFGFGIVVACCLGLLAIGVASASANFGVFGVVDLSAHRSGYGFEAVNEVKPGPGGEIYVLGRPASCSQVCVADLRVERFLADGFRDKSYGKRSESPLVSAGGEAALTVDARGRALIAIGSPTELAVVRLGADGQTDDTFGEKGVARVPCACDGPQASVSVSVSVDGKGRVIAGVGPFTARFSARGHLDRSYGKSGTSIVDFSDLNAPTVSLTESNGAVLQAGSFEESSGSQRSIYVVRVGPNGKVDRRFEANAHAALFPLSRLEAGRPINVAAVIARPHGEVDLLGEAQEGSYVVRVRADGKLDRRFGDGGMTLIKAASISSAAVDASGRVFVLGFDTRSAYGLLGFWLRADGHPAGPLKELRYPITAESVIVGSQSGKHPILFDAGLPSCRSYCPAQPILERFPAFAAATQKVHHG